MEPCHSPLLANCIRHADSTSTVMGGQSLRHEPKDTMRVRSNHEVWQVFENAGLDVYFDRLRGSNEEIMMEFALNMGEGGSRFMESKSW